MIVLLGLNHKSASLTVREKFVFCEEDIKRFGDLLKARGFLGTVILSTCNRTEIYIDIEDNPDSSDFNFLEEILFNYRNADKKLSNHFYRKSDDEVARHLFHVVSGLDSMALGEYQIAGQVKDAYNISKKYNLMSPVLIRLFNKSFEAGKKVRTETCICKGAVSISYAAVHYAGKKLHNIQSQPALLIGAGQTSELTLQNLIKKGCNKFTIVNRTYRHAFEIASKYKGNAEDFNRLEELLLENNIIIASTASKKPLITKDMVEKAMILRNNKPLFFIDLSVPRNIAHEVAEINNVYIYDIDDLNNIVEETFEQRRGEICAAEQIIEGMVNEFSKWVYTRKLIPAIQNINNYFQNISKKELNNFIKSQRQPDCPELSEYAEQITNKLIHTMIRNVKSLTDNGKNQEYISFINQMFNKN